MPVVMIVIASAAADFSGFGTHQRNDGVIGHAAAFNAVIVNYIAEAKIRHSEWRVTAEYIKTETTISR